MTITTSDEATKAVADKATDTTHAASGAASTATSGQNPAAGSETMFDALKRTILGIFKRPS